MQLLFLFVNTHRRAVSYQRTDVVDDTSAASRALHLPSQKCVVRVAMRYRERVEGIPVLLRLALQGSE